MKLKNTLSCIATLLLAGSALHAGPITITQSDTHNATFSGIDFAFSKFDSSLGTLTGVSLTIYSVQNPGNFTITSDKTGAVLVTGWADRISVNDTNGGTGADPYTSNFVSLNITPSPFPITVANKGSQIFTISTAQNLVNNDFVPITGDFSGYQSIGGSGNATFTTSIKPAASTGLGGGYNPSYTNLTANTTLTIAYTYTSNPGPVSVPEPSTVIVQMLIVAVGIWMFVRRRRAAAAQA
ncbi:MAG: choice-of-anchor E domain-containing protein [Verrucomicrobiota bacterium]